MKRIFAILLLLTLCLSCFLTACEKKNKNKDNETPQNTEPSAEQQQQERNVIADALDFSKYLPSEGEEGTAPEGNVEPAESPLIGAIAALDEAMEQIAQLANELNAEIKIDALIDEGTDDEEHHSIIIAAEGGVFYMFEDEEYIRYAAPFAEIPYAIEIEDDGRIDLSFIDFDLSELLLGSIDFEEAIPVESIGGMLQELPFDLPGADDLEYRDGLYYIKDAYFINLFQNLMFGEVDVDALSDEYREQYLEQMAEATQMLTDIFNNLHLSIAFGVSQNKISRVKINIAPSEQFFEALAEMGMEMPELPFSSCSLALDLSIDVAHDLPISFSLEAHAPDFADVTLNAAFQTGSILLKTFALDANVAQYGEGHINATFHDGLPVPAQLTVQANVPGILNADVTLSTTVNNGLPSGLTTEGTIALTGVTLTSMSSSRYDEVLDEYVKYDEQKVVGDIGIQFNIALDLTKVGGAETEKPLTGTIVVSTSNAAYYHNGQLSQPIPNEMGYVRTVGINFDSENIDGYSVFSVDCVVNINGKDPETADIRVTVYPDSAPDFEPLDESYNDIIAKRDQAEQKLQQVLADLQQSDIDGWEWRRFYIEFEDGFYISFYADEYMEDGEFELRANIDGDYYTALEYEDGQLVDVEYAPEYGIK